MAEPLKYSHVFMISPLSLFSKTSEDHCSFTVCCNDYESFQLISGNVLQNQLICCIDIYCLGIMAFMRL